MRVCGIIAEFNPFHNGHQYLIHKAKEITSADTVVVVMSGDFVQRGEPALIDKYHRTRMALAGGADLVLELPVVFATGSAEYFARGAVSALLHSGIVTDLVFGSECGDLDILSATAPTQDMSPNDILGCHYLKALKHFHSKGICPHTLTRCDKGYLSEEPSGSYASAHHIRHLLLENNDLDVHSDTHSHSEADYRHFLPESSSSILSDISASDRWMTMEDFHSALAYALLLHKDTYNEIFDIYPDLADKIKNNAEYYHSYETFVESLKSKDLSWGHLKRAMIHILLDIRKDTLASVLERDYCAYLRVLGVRNDSSRVLSDLYNKADRPVLTSLAGLNTEEYPGLREDIFASEFYSTVNKKDGIRSSNEYRHPVIKY